MEEVLKVGTILLSIATIGLFVQSLRLRKLAIRRRRDNRRWINGEVERALKQLESQDEAEVLAGCQTLYALAEYLGEASRSKLVELARSDNPRIASQASMTYGKAEQLSAA